MGKVTLYLFFGDGDVADDADAHLVEGVHRHRHQHQGQQVGRCNDGGHQRNQNDGMATIVRHQLSIDNPHLGEKERDDRNLKHDSHHEGQRGERGDVGRQVDLVDHTGIDLIGAQKAERKREQHEIAHHHPGDKQCVDRQRDAHTVAPLVVVERRGNKAEQLDHNVGRGEEQRQIDRGGEVGHELTGQLGVDERDPECLEVKVQPHQGTQPLDGPIGEKVTVGRGEQHAECLGREAEDGHRRHQGYDDNADEHLAQDLEMPTECHHALIVGAAHCCGVSQESEGLEISDFSEISSAC